MPPPRVQAKFIEPMLLLRTDNSPEGGGWLLELKLDGYRAIALTRTSAPSTRPSRRPLRRYRMRR
jgi:ATP-dependent DNA ligase